MVTDTGSDSLKYGRVLLKITGESFCAENGRGIDALAVRNLAGRLIEAASAGVQMAVVIGGGSLSGGEGSVLGSVVGALIMTIIRSGCSQMGLPNWVQEIVTGSIIVIAVAIDRLRHRRSR